MGGVYGTTKTPDAWKPEQFKHYLTIGEVALLVKRDKSRIKQLERKGRVPAPIRVQVGRHSVRLYSAEETATIVEYFKNAKPGRPITTGTGKKRKKRRKQ